MPKSVPVAQFKSPSEKYDDLALLLRGLLYNVDLRLSSSQTDDLAAAIRRAGFRRLSELSLGSVIDHVHQQVTTGPAATRSALTSEDVAQVVLATLDAILVDSE